MDTILEIKEKLKKISSIRKSADLSGQLKVYVDTLNGIKLNLKDIHKIKYLKKIISGSNISGLTDVVENIKKESKVLLASIKNDQTKLTDSDNKNLLRSLRKNSESVSANLQSDWNTWLDGVVMRYNPVESLIAQIDASKAKKMKSAIGELISLRGDVPGSEIQEKKVQALINKMDELSRDIGMSDEDVKRFWERVKMEGVPLDLILNSSKIKKFINENNLSSTFVVRFKG